MLSVHPHHHHHHHHHRQCGRKLWEVMNMFMALVLMVSQVYTLPQSHQITYSKCVKFLHINHTSEVPGSTMIRICLPMQGNRFDP